MMFALPALLVLAVFQAQDPAGSIRGRVLTESRGVEQPVVSAIVEITGPAGRRMTLTDPAGRYTVAALGSGTLTVRVMHVGYEEARAQVMLPPAGNVDLDVTLKGRLVTLPGVRVNLSLLARSVLPDRPGIGATDRDRAELGIRTLEATPGLAESGLGDAARGGSANDPSDPSDVLFMRGSTADMKLVLLDGAPVYTPFHLGGLLRSFDAGLLGTATHHVGGAPARYDGGLSYVLDLRTRSPARDRIRGGASIDLMGASATIEAPVTERGGVIASTRALHGLQSRMAGGGSSPYGYVEGLARAEVDVREGRRLSALFFTNEESVRLSLPADPSAPVGVVATPPAPESARWGNTAFSATWAEEWERGLLEVGVAASRYDASLPVPGRASHPGIAPDPANAALAFSETDRLRFTVDGVRFVEGGALRFGLAADHLRMHYGSRELAAARDTTPTFSAMLQGMVAGAYVDALRPLTSEFALRGGVRFDHYYPGGTRAAARLALIWDLSEAARLTVAGGRYHQFVRTVNDPDLGLTADGLAGLLASGPAARLDGPALVVGTADHLVVSLEQRLTPAVNLSTEGFYKRFDGVGKPGATDLNASGLELRVVRAGERVAGWLGYSLSWLWDSPDALGRADAFTGRHLLSAGVHGHVFGPWNLDVTFAYGDGLPLTSIPHPGGRTEVGISLAPNDSGDQPVAAVPTSATSAFLRADVELYADLTPRWRERTVQLRPYLRVLNALNRRDGMFYYFEPWRDSELRPLADLPAIPILGLEWRF